MTGSNKKALNGVKFIQLHTIADKARPAILGLPQIPRALFRRALFNCSRSFTSFCKPGRAIPRGTRRVTR